MDFLDELTMDLLDGESLYLAQALGMDAFKRLLRDYGSSGRMYVPSVTTITAPIRNRHLYEDYLNGATVYELTKKYELGESMVRRILNDFYKGKER